MAEISLSAYQNELDGLLGQDSHDEVIAHARHILKAQPKNLRAYQQLGDALIGAGRWDEAGSVFRRTLGAQPQDFHTHTQLARACQNLAQLERAIWHAERALEQKPSDQETIALIRGLYRAHSHQEIDRFRLTAAAQAQRQIRGARLHEALETLATALEASPERVDLRLLRARALWLDGQRMDAAEAALDILDRLPYAIDANRIMTELWLAEQRPSDAQLYLKRIEELDPYLARQMASGEPAPETLLTLDRLDYSASPPDEDEIVDPEWLNDLDDAPDEAADAEDSGGLGALLGIGESEPAPAPEGIAGLAGLLADRQMEDLFSELVIGGPVAAVSAAPPEDDEAEALLDAMEERGFIDGQARAPVNAEAEALAEGPQERDREDDATEAAGARPALDDDLADLLQRLDDSDEGGDWMAEIQAGSLAPGGDDDSLEYLDDFEREWVKAGAEEDEAGAPWPSAAMREALDKSGDGDLVAGDEPLQTLLSLDADTEPLHLSDIEDWLMTEPEANADEADERFVDIDDDTLLSPPADSWLDDDATEAPAVDADPNQRNAELIEGWGAELGDDDDDDPYVDWLRDDPNELDDEAFRALAAEADVDAAPDQSGSAAERARAWGLDDADQLADFVEESGGSEGAPDWLNAVVPGLDRENDAATDDVNEYARPMSSPGKEFAWVSDIVDEETGEMKAVDPDADAPTPYFRFSRPPKWLNALQERASESADLSGAAALSLDVNIDALELDDLTFDDYFNFDTPTDKLDAISLDDDTQQLNFTSLDWDDYFDLESPTEKTIAISLDEDADKLDYKALGVDDADFDFEAPADEAAESKDDISFDDIGLGNELIASVDDRAEAPPAWLSYDSPASDERADDEPGRNRRGSQSTL